MGFASSVNLRLRKGDWIAEGTGDNKEIVGQVVKYKIEKNKTFKRMQTGEFEFYFAENKLEIPVHHNDNFKSTVVQGIAWGLIERGGAWFTLDKEKDLKFQGVDNLIAFLRENPQYVDKIKEQVLDLSQKSR